MWAGVCLKLLAKHNCLLYPKNCLCIEAQFLFLEDFKEVLYYENNYVKPIPFLPHPPYNLIGRFPFSLLMFNAGIINLETGTQEAGDTVNYQNLNDGISAMKELALRLTGQDWAISA
jgi:hypothetical protein